MEKTFEELIEPFKKYENFWLFDPQQKELNKAFENQLKEFGKQVREATISEVLNLADDNLFNKEPKVKLMGQIEEMKTDRIKLTENK